MNKKCCGFSLCNARFGKGQGNSNWTACILRTKVDNAIADIKASEGYVIQMGLQELLTPEIAQAVYAEIKHQLRDGWTHR